MRSFIIAGLLAFLVIGGTANGLVLKKSLGQLTDESTLIVKGKVITKESYWNEAHNRIWTTLKIQVSEYIKGTGSSVITFRVPGGTVGDTTLYVSDAPQWKEGEEVLLFLNPGNYYPVVGWFQGKYRIEGNMAVNEIDPERTMPLDEMISQIRRNLKE